MKKLLLTLLASLILITGSLWSYDLTTHEEELVAQIVVLLQKESPAKQKQIITMLQTAQQTLTDEKRLAIVDALLTAIEASNSGKNIVVEYESDIDFDSIYDEFLSQMREENMQQHMLDIMSEADTTPAHVTLEAEGTIDGAAVDASMDMVIDPSESAVDGNIALSVTSSEFDAAADIDIKSNDEAVYMKLNHIDAPENTIPAELVVGAQLLEGKWLYIPLMEDMMYEDMVWQDMYSDMLGDEDVSRYHDMLVTDDVWIHDTSRRTTDSYIPIMMTSTYADQTSTHLQEQSYSFLQYNNQWLLQSVSDSYTQAIGTDVIYIKSTDYATITKTTITSSDENSLDISMEVEDADTSSLINIDITYQPKQDITITYPEDVVDMTEMVSQTQERAR